ncbi:hypothetical protein BQ8482_280103 [Mesorhizobium delmotii]|uniref:Uncharacterized protein n=1 Tax=Mesorhizobium delmotii TaxID=1631247 RepID=A0A2P9AML4_9HYPH|nr:hypothetical protein BQ8482_280103 [Mesorhizobium delmotii]
MMQWTALRQGFSLFWLKESEKKRRSVLSFILSGAPYKIGPTTASRAARDSFPCYTLPSLAGAWRMR